jgi:hypothetical protein
MQSNTGVTATLRRTNKTSAVQGAIEALKTPVSAPTSETKTVECQGVEIETTVGDGGLAAELLPPATNETATGNPEESEDPNTTAAVATRPDFTVAPKGRFFDESGGAFEGEFDSSDLKHPMLKLVQGSGPLSKKFAVGSVILGEDLLLPVQVDPKAAAPTFKFIPVHLLKQFRENLPEGSYEAGIMPRTVNSIAEVEANGGTTAWIGQEKPSWSPSARCLLLVQRPENSDHPGFAFEYDGTLWAPAIYFCAGGSYRRFAAKIFSAKTSMYEGKGAERHFVPGRFIWEWKTIRTDGQYATLVPDIKILSKEVVGPEIRKAVVDFLGSADGEAAQVES